MAAGPPIRVRVRLFALQRELAGTRALDLELPPGASIGAAWAELCRRVPALAPGSDSVRFARNGEYAAVSTALADGDELACIPPVSGGAGEDHRAEGSGGPGRTDPLPEGDPAGWLIELRAERFGAEILGELADRLATEADGAVCGFLGRTRSTPGTPAPGQEAEAARHAGRRVESLAYEAHETMALAVLRRIAAEVGERFAVERIGLVHRTGDVPVGEPSVAVVAVAPHRDAAFAAARYAIDELKARAPIWKAEGFADGHVWLGSPARTGPPPLEEPR